MAGIPHDHYEPKTGAERWLHRRLPIVSLLYDTLMIPTPKNLNWMWIWGIVLTFCLVLQIATGIVLVMHYTPDTSLAFASVEHIMRDVNGGHMLRYLHSNGATLFFPTREDALDPDTASLPTNLQLDDVPFQPWARALAEARLDGSHSREDPPANCLPQGVPRLGGAPAPWKVVQTDDLVVVIYEAFNLWRQIFIDGRRLAPDVQPTWLGYSTGHWDGDTLVVDTRGFNGRAWLDQVGKPSTEQLHVVERYTRKDYGHMQIEITIDDPGAYTKPWTITEQVHVLPDTELLEFICNENNTDLEHLPAAGG